jgi:hypothetical protein
MQEVLTEQVVEEGTGEELQDLHPVGTWDREAGEADMWVVV